MFREKIFSKHKLFSPKICREEYFSRKFENNFLFEFLERKISLTFREKKKCFELSRKIFSSHFQLKFVFQFCENIFLFTKNSFPIKIGYLFFCGIKNIIQFFEQNFFFTKFEKKFFFTIWKEIYLHIFRKEFFLHIFEKKIFFPNFETYFSFTKKNLWRIIFVSRNFSRNKNYSHNGRIKLVSNFSKQKKV